MKIAFIVNSIARNAKDLIARIRDHPGLQAHESDIHQTSYQDHAREIAKEHSAASDVIVAVGGDGTLNEVVNGIMLSDPVHRPKLALIPNGSANDFARIQQIPADLDSLTEAILNGSSKSIDIGRIHIRQENKVHYFINVADSGFGAEVVQRLEERSVFRKILNSDMRFALAILRTFLSYRRKNVEIRLDNEADIKGRILTLVVANSRAFGSGLIVAPDAEIDDGKFQLLVGDLSLIDYLINIGRLLKGKRLTNKGVKYFEASKIEIKGPANLWTQADGELTGSGDVVIECNPEAIEMFLPKYI